jgi:hypothetical protein
MPLPLPLPLPLPVRGDSRLTGNKDEIKAIEERRHGEPISTSIVGPATA